MPEKYHINTKPVPPRMHKIGRLGIVDFREDCSRCHDCVKKKCIYNVYVEESDYLLNTSGFVDYQYNCQGCLSCVQNCTKSLLTCVMNPEYKRLGNDYWRPEIITTTWNQAETGKIPVSGAGYTGPFCGTGFDSIWTDMSEIVRPTRDGIHGREYISTSVDIGRKLKSLQFDNDGNMISEPPPILEIPIPVIFDLAGNGNFNRKITEIITKAAADLDIFCIVPSEKIDNVIPEHAENIIPLFSSLELHEVENGLLSNFKIVEIPYKENTGDLIIKIREINPEIIISVRLYACDEVPDKVVEIVHAGADVIHVIFDDTAREFKDSSPGYAKDILRSTHIRILEDNSPHQVTLISGGGIALAEHMAKSIICGADLVSIDLPLMISLECRLCNRCKENGGKCVIGLEDIDIEFSVQRIKNLMGAWHSQLLEVMGAMGIREARRLKGEMGRAMFLEDLEKATFGSMFGNT